MNYIKIQKLIFSQYIGSEHIFLNIIINNKYFFITNHLFSMGHDKLNEDIEEHHLYVFRKFRYLKKGEKNFWNLEKNMFENIEIEQKLYNLLISKDKEVKKLGFKILKIQLNKIKNE